MASEILNVTIGVTLGLTLFMLLCVFIGTISNAMARKFHYEMPSTFERHCKSDSNDDNQSEKNDD